MKRHLHLLLLFFGLLICTVFFQSSWWEILGFLFLLGFCIWNVFAFTNERDMVAPPKMTSNVTASGDMGARHFLFGLSLLLFLMLIGGWVYRYFDSAA